MRKVTSLLGVGLITGAMVLGMVACNDDDEDDGDDGGTTPVATEQATPATGETPAADTTPSTGETGTPTS